MTHLKLLSVLVLSALSLIGCKTDQEKQLEKQVEVCRQDYKDGKELTQWCIDRVPEFRSLAVQQTTNTVPQYQEQVQSYIPQQYPLQQATPTPVVINQAQPQQDNTVSNMVTGALAGHVLSNAFNNNQQQYQQPTTVNKTYIIKDKPQSIDNRKFDTDLLKQKAIVPSTNYMDMSKLRSTGVSTQSFAPIRKPSMDMSKLNTTSKSISRTPSTKASVNFSKMKR